MGKGTKGNRRSTTRVRPGGHLEFSACGWAKAGTTRGEALAGRAWNWFGLVCSGRLPGCERER